jgi:hypothetical protein
MALPIPEDGIFDEPDLTVTINQQWLSILDGQIGKLLQDGIWIGDDDETFDANQEVYKLLDAIAFHPPTPQETLFGNDTPAYDDLSSGTGNVGVRFKSAVDGNILGIRHFRVSGEPNDYIGGLWQLEDFVLLTSAYFPDDNLGWIVATFDEPYAIIADQIYVASVFAPSGHITYKIDYFVTDIVNGNLTAPEDDTGGDRNGLYDTSPVMDFPPNGIAAINFYVDVLFEAT